MNNTTAANMLKELGHPVRLKIFKLLVKKGHKGVTVGAIKEELNIPNSTLTHHISSLAGVKLLTQTREGRSLYCKTNYKHFQKLMIYLQQECCEEE